MRLERESDFVFLMACELKNSARHRRFASILAVAPQNESFAIDRFLSESIRESDAFCVIGGVVYVLMGETNRAGARRASERFREALRLAGEAWFAVAEFPHDGGDPTTLFDSVRQRLEQAKAQSAQGLAIANG